MVYSIFKWAYGYNVVVVREQTPERGLGRERVTTIALRYP